MVHDEYVFAYHIVIENRGYETVTLKRRFWRITDAMGRIDEIEGEGVVGETPTLAPTTNLITPAAPVCTRLGVK